MVHDWDAAACGMVDSTGILFDFSLGFQLADQVIDAGIGHIGWNFIDAEIDFLSRRKYQKPID